MIDLQRARAQRIQEAACKLDARRLVRTLAKSGIVVQAEDLQTGTVTVHAMDLLQYISERSTYEAGWKDGWKAAKRKDPR
jgi:hypothetical protein